MGGSVNSDTKKILVVIPALNEERSIGSVISSIRAARPDAAILVVDDGSADGTGAAARKAGTTVVRHVLNLGYGSSLETGYKYAIACGYEIVVQMDGDGQHIASEISHILNPILNDDADIVIGSRYLFEQQLYKTSVARRVGQTFFGFLLYLLTGSKITDPTSGFQCLNRKTFGLFASGHFPDDFPDTDVLLIAHFAKLRIKEVPVAMKARKDGISMHSGLKPLYYIIKMMLSMSMVVLNREIWRRHVI